MSQAKASLSAALESNPLLRTDGIPRFDEIAAEHVVPAVTHVLDAVGKGLSELEAMLEPTWDGVMAPLEALEIPMEHAWDPVKHLMSVKNSPELREAHDAMLSDVVQIRLRVKQSRPIYDALRALKDGDEWKSLDNAQRRAVELRLRDAEHAGVGLDGDECERFKAIESKLSQLGSDFQNHVLDATKAFELIITDQADIEGWPETLKQLASQSWSQANPDDEASTADGGPWRITLDFPSFGPFLQHSRNRVQREKLYRAHMTRASEGEWDNTEIVSTMLKLKLEKAKLLGFDTYADLSLSEKMASKVDAVEVMFSALVEASKPRAQKDLEDLKELAGKNGHDGDLKHWDVAFWSERLRESRFDYTDDQLRPYFPMPGVLDGLFSLSKRLLGIVIEPADGETSVWHEDVRYFKVSNEDGTPIAFFYLDAYSRPAEKRGGAWMGECLGRRIVDGKVRLPVVYLTCNSTPPVGDKPSLMGFREVETLFHEFGHGLQAMLTTIDYADVAGINGVEWDAVELASQFMENWCYHKPTLMGMTSHFETGEPLPDELFEKISAARTFRAGSLMMRQLELGISDMELHSSHDPNGERTAFDVHRDVVLKTSVLPPFEGDRLLCAFAHIFGGPYAAGYYSYKWAEVLSADAFGAFEEVGLDNEEAVRKLGRRYRDTILSVGGSRHPMDVFRDFRGREPSTEALLRHNDLLSEGS
jgi:oligopeptidase A